jgi:hypothetical protein
MKTKLHFFFIYFLISSNIIFSQTQKAKYSITFTSVWNDTDHGTLPGGSHWSRLVGATHKSNNTFWSLGSIASTGVKNIAETGNNTVFNNEVNTSIANLESDQYINGNSLGSATGTITINDLIVNKDFPLLTLLSMIAPSPDWYIGVNSIKLTDDDSNWKSSISLDLFGYDSGTDDGNNYSSTNAATNPFQDISNLKNIAPFNDKKIGTLSITLTETLSVEKHSNNTLFSVFYSKESKSIQINDTKNQLTGLKIYSITGNLVHNGYTKNTSKLNISNLSNGTYVLKTRTGSGIYSKKILKY